MIDTNKAREIAQRLKDPKDWYRVTASGKLIDDASPEAAAALLLALADERDRMVKTLEDIEVIAGDYDFRSAFREWARQRAIYGRTGKPIPAIDAAMGESNG